MDAETDSNTTMIKLISGEGHEFFVDRRCAMVSGTIKAMLSGQFAESRGEIRFPEIPGVILEKVPRPSPLLKLPTSFLFLFTPPSPS